MIKLSLQKSYAQVVVKGKNNSNNYQGILSNAAAFFPLYYLFLLYLLSIEALTLHDLCHTTLIRLDTHLLRSQKSKLIVD